jgi:MoaA/NifB/PqqE/SkfB family radical SAM enzyme
MKHLSFPLLVSIQITDDCNCNCKYCYNTKRKNQYISAEDFEFILDILVKGKVFHIVLEGGEPFMHIKLINFCKAIQKKQIDVTVITNATLITPSVASELSKINCNVIASIDSTDYRIHNITRNHAQKALSGIECLLNSGVSVGINTVITRHNIDSCESIIERFYPRIKRFSFLKLIPRSKKDYNIRDLLSFSKNQLSLLNIRLRKIKEQYPDIKIISPFNFPNDSTTEFQESLDVPGCLAGTTYLTIKPNLDVIPCSYAQNLVIGNLKKSSFNSIWDDSKLEVIKCGSSIPCAINLTVTQEKAPS